MTAGQRGDAPLRIVHVVGARPQFVKLAPVCRAVEEHNRQGGRRIESLIVHTGQHYDPTMSEVFFEELEIPDVTRHLGIGSGTHGQQTARMLEALETVLAELRPRIVLSYGDTNSTLAATLAAAKLHLSLGHVEAGLRSFDRRMPEEINRITADHLSDLLLAPTMTAMRNLEREGLAARAVLTGDVMLDAIRFELGRASGAGGILERLGLEPERYLVATIHRAENTEPAVFARLIDALEQVARRFGPVIFPVHPRARALLGIARPTGPEPSPLRPIAPLGYRDMLRLVASARVVLTDSGGLQKEAFFLGRPCVTLRERTEWLETVEGGGNVITGTDPSRIAAAVARWHDGAWEQGPAVAGAFGEGAAAHRIVQAVLAFAPGLP